MSFSMSIMSLYSLFFITYFGLYGNMHPNQIAVVVFPEPEELKARAVKRFKEMGKEVPAEAVNEMLGILLVREH